MTDDYIQRRLNWIDGDQQHQAEEAGILGQQRGGSANLHSALSGVSA
jgi:hypothetical protein